jgi:multidrug efflux pump subunit AcrA (membrane-fusion protein)
MIDPSGPSDLFMAAGLFNQRLYVLPSQDLVVVRLGRADRSWDDAAFLGRLLRGETDNEPASVDGADASTERIVRLATDRQMARLDSALALTDPQEEAIRPAVRRQIRSLLDLRSERDRRSPLSRRDKRALYRRAMQIQRDAQTAIEAELRPDQRETYRAFVEQERERRRENRD